MKVSELQNSELPKDFIAVIPTHCEICGSELEITESLTMLYCPNPFCKEKSVHRLLAMLRDLGVKNMGEAKCRAFLDHFETTNPYAIFMYEPDIDGPLYEGCSMDFSYSIYEQINERRKMLLWEYVKIGNLPGIRDSARKLLGDYDDLEEFYEDLENGGIAFVQELLSIKGKINGYDDTEVVFYDTNEEDEIAGVSVKAVDVYHTLMQFKDDLFEALDYVEIKKLTTPVINICISTAVGYPYTSKQDFVAKMNERYGHKVHLNFLGSVTNDCQFLIWSKEGPPTNKVRKALSINEKRREKNIMQGLPEDSGLIQIMTGAEFEEYLSKL